MSLPIINESAVSKREIKSRSTVTITMPLQRQKTNYKTVLLIYPPFYIETGKGRKESYGAAVLPPLGMLTLAGELENNNYKVSFIDAECEMINDEKLLAIILEKKPDVLGFSCMTANYNRLIAMSTKIKEVVPDTLIFFGGPHVWHTWTDTLKTGVVDFVVIGEGEESTCEVLNNLNSGKSLGDIKGIAFREGEEIVFTGKRPFINNLDKLAYAAYHLVDINKYRPSPQHVIRKPSVTMTVSRGCPFKCTFCYVPYLFEGTFRLRSVDNVVGEIKQLVEKHGVKEIQFMDDLFGANKRWLEQFLDKLIKEKIDITWSCLTRVDIMDWGLAKKMKKAGCWCLFFGCESLDQEILNAVNKRQTVEQIETAIKSCKKAGIQVRANFILGSPAETPEKAKKMIDKLCKLNPDYVKFNVMTPYPGLKIYDEVKEGKWGRLIDGYDPEKLTNHEVVFIPFGYKDVNEILDIRKYAYRKYYFRPRYILSRLTKIKTIYDVKRYWMGLKLVSLRYLFNYGAE